MTITSHDSGDTFTTPAGEVTDHDPGGVQWAAARVEAQPIEDDELGSCAFEEGQTHRTVAGFYEWEADDIVDGMPTHPARTDVDTGDGDGVKGYWSTYALVPAEVPAELRPRGEAWSDLLCALALVVGRPGTNPTSPLHCEHDELTLNAHPADFTEHERAQLTAWGFSSNEDESALRSFRFGSA